MTTDDPWEGVLREALQGFDEPSFESKGEPSSEPKGASLVLTPGQQAMFRELQQFMLRLPEMQSMILVGVPALPVEAAQGKLWLTAVGETFHVMGLAYWLPGALAERLFPCGEY